MAGSWPDMPSRKIPYHDDGTVVAGRHPTGGAPYENFYEWNATYVNEMNDLDFVKISEDWSDRRFPAMSGTYSASQLNKRTESVWIFPERRDLYGYAFVILQDNTGTGGLGAHYCYTSVDTTNGIDGTWTQWGPIWVDDNITSNNYPEAWRENQYTEARTNVRGVLWLGTGGTFNAGPDVWKAMFLFGEIAAGETPDRILFIDNYTGLEFDKPMDWGDVPRGSTLTWDIYLLNNSTTLQANSMDLTFGTLYNSSNTWYEMKVTGGGYGTSITGITMAASARYPAGTDVITIKLDVPDTQALGVFEAFLELSKPTSWT